MNQGMARRAPENAPGAIDMAALRARVRGTNINPDTLLATDYLNHFNEIIMLLELVPDAPECFEDVKAWQPRGYAEHFRESGLSDGPLAAACYDVADPRYRAPFDGTVAALNRRVERAVAEIEAALESGLSVALGEIVTAACADLQQKIGEASAIIHGAGAALGQDAIDKLFD